MKTLIKYSLITAVAFLMTIAAYGAETVGSVVLLKGKLKIQKADRFEIVETRDKRVPVMESDQIHAGENTRARIFMQGQKETVHLYANSFLTLEKVNEEKSQVSVLIGKARFVVEPTTSKLTSLRRKFEIRTGNTFIGIRGTDVLVQTSGVTTNVLAIAGIVGVANLLNIDQIVELLKNQASRVVRDALPSPAVTVPQEVIDQILAADEAQEWQGVTFIKRPSARRQPVLIGDELNIVREVNEDIETARDQLRSTDSADSDKSVSVKIVETE